MHKKSIRTCWTIAVVGAIGAVGCTPSQQVASHADTPQVSLSGGWIDATATLDPLTTPVYEGDAPMKFDFLKDMRKGDGLTLSAYSLGAHSGTHIDAPMHSCGTAHRSIACRWSRSSDRRV